MGFYLTALEAGTEGITAEEVSDTIEPVSYTHLELAMIQNCIVECELYSLLAKIIRGTKSGKKISLRRCV